MKKTFQKLSIVCLVLFLLIAAMGLSACTRLKSYTIEVRAAENGKVVDGAGNFIVSSAQHFICATAEPDEGYYFIGWYSNGDPTTLDEIRTASYSTPDEDGFSLVSTDLTYNFVTPYADYIVEARFAMLGVI